MGVQAGPVCSVFVHAHVCVPVKQDHQVKYENDSDLVGNYYKVFLSIYIIEVQSTVFQVYSKVIQLYIYIYMLFFRLSVIGYYKILQFPVLYSKSLLLAAYLLKLKIQCSSHMKSNKWSQNVINFFLFNAVKYKAFRKRPDSHRWFSY